jgi:hypothetical protein
MNLTGDSAPSEQELVQIFASQQVATPVGAPVAAPEAQPSFPGAGFIEPAAALISGAVAEPVAGLVGIATAIDPFAEPGAGAEAVEATREALTFQPRTEAGQAGLRTVGEALEPVAEALQSAETFLGDETFEATGSPALAAAAKTIPTALIEAVGLAAGKGVLKGAEKTKIIARNKAVRSAIVEAAPDIDQLKDTSRAVYKELDNSGVVLRQKAFNGLVNRVDKAVRKAGFDPDLTPKTSAVLKRFESELGKPHNLTEIDNLRKVAQNAAAAIEPADARLGSIIVDNVDQFLDVVSPTAFKGGTLKAPEIASKYRVARELWGRARRSELINTAFEKAKNQASGFENGLVVQFRSILNNTKKSRFFKPKELEAMQKVVRGTTKENIAKVIGRFGFSEGHATNILGGSIGIAGGAAVGGPVGAVAVPVIGQVSRKLAQKLTRNNAELADIIVRAGTNADDIASAYLRKFPKAQRSARELSELLSRPDIAVDKLLESGNALVREAAEISRGNQILTAIAAPVAIGAPGAVKSLAEQEQ